MSRLKEWLRHRRRVRENRGLAGGRLDLPKPLPLVTWIDSRAELLDAFLNALITNTVWPLRVLVCDASEGDPAVERVIESWAGSRSGRHEIERVPGAPRTHPDVFNRGLARVREGIVAIADPVCIVPDLRPACWASVMLSELRRFPHVGWLAAAGQSRNSTHGVNRVQGTNGTILDLPPETTLAVFRKDALPEKSSGLQLPNRPPIRVTPQVATGWTTQLEIRLHGAREIPRAVAAADAPADVPFYMITRTHGRPDYFARCRESIERQTLADRVVHVVTCDQESDREYIPPECLRVDVEPRPDVGHYFNTYVTAALERCDEGGLVMMLDDDDYLCSRYVVEDMLRSYDSLDAALFRVRLESGRSVPRLLPFDAPVSGDIASCGWVLRSEIARRVPWRAGQAGDHVYINDIFRFHLPDRGRILWCEDVHTSLQTGAHFGGKPSGRRARLKYMDRHVSLKAH